MCPLYLPCLIECYLFFRNKIARLKSRPDWNHKANYRVTFYWSRLEKLFICIWKSFFTFLVKYIWYKRILADILIAGHGVKENLLIFWNTWYPKKNKDSEQITDNDQVGITTLGSGWAPEHLCWNTFFIIALFRSGIFFIQPTCSAVQNSDVAQCKRMQRSLIVEL